MTSRHPSSPFIEDRVFYRILAGSFVFYLILIFFLFIIPFDLNRSLLKPVPSARKIRMAMPPAQPVSKPLPPTPFPKPEQKKSPVPIVPKKRENAPPPSPALEQKKPEPKKEIPPQPTQEEIEQKKAEALALQRAKELEKNKEVAKSKFISLFGSGADDVLQDKGLNVIATSKPSTYPAVKEVPGVNLTDDLRVPIKNQEADRILKGLPSGKDKQGTALLGEHETKHFASGSGIEKVGSIRSPEDFEKSFKAYEGRLKSFYDKTIQTKPSLKGVLVVRITLAADGTVARCEILSSSLNDKKFENEIAQLIQEQFRFSKIAQGEEYHDRALNFHPEK